MMSDMISQFTKMKNKNQPSQKGMISERNKSNARTCSL